MQVKKLIKFYILIDVHPDIEAVNSTGIVCLYLNRFGFEGWCFHSVYKTKPEHLIVCRDLNMLGKCSQRIYLCFIWWNSFRENGKHKLLWHVLNDATNGNWNAFENVKWDAFIKRLRISSNKIRIKSYIKWRKKQINWNEIAWEK